MPTLLVCWFCRKELFIAMHNFVHLNLAIALFVGYLVFAVGVELAADNDVCVYNCFYVETVRPTQIEARQCK